MNSSPKVLRDGAPLCSFYEASITPIPKSKNKQKDHKKTTNPHPLGIQAHKPSLNISKLNLATYNKDYTPQPVEM